MNLFLVSFLALISSSVAMSPNPNSYKVSNDDGFPTTLRIVGSEEDHVEETIDGYTVGWVGGAYCFLEQGKNGNLVSTGKKLGPEGPPPGLAKHLRQSKDAKEANCKNNGWKCTGITFNSEPTDNIFGDGQSPRHERLLRGGIEDQQHQNQQGVRRKLQTGTMKNLVIIFKFNDHTSRTVPSQANIHVLMNNNGPDASRCPTGSVRDVFLKNSYGQLTLVSTVAAWVTLDSPYTEAYCANENSGLTTLTHHCLANALNKVQEAGINFVDFDDDGDGYIDGITFLHSGYGAEWGGTDSYGTPNVNRMWSHQWALFDISDGGGSGWTSNSGVSVYKYHISPAIWGTSGSIIGRIGVIAHETGHFLDMPDMYDTDSDGEGIGSYELVANSWGFDGSQRYPPLMSAWTKIALGWTTPNVITADGTYTLEQACDSPLVYKINHTFPIGEYLLIENRQPCSFDGDIPQGGLAIFHVDSSASVNHNTEGYPTVSGWNGTHYRVALLQVREPLFQRRTFQILITNFIMTSWTHSRLMVATTSRKETTAAISMICSMAVTSIPLDLVGHLLDPPTPTRMPTKAEMSSQLALK
jgi:M6 family metalloprotease-like protein